MKRVNLYVHYDSVTNYMMTRALSLTSDDFSAQNLPNNLILAEAPANFGRFDVQTNFKILRGRSGNCGIALPLPLFQCPALSFLL